MKLDVSRVAPFERPPRPRPSNCPQKMWLSAQLCHDFVQIHEVLGEVNVSTWELAGNSYYNGYPYMEGAPPPPYFENWHGFYSEISEVNPPATSKSVTSQTPWLNLPIDWHCVNWVKAYVEGEIYAADGKVVGDASSCMTGSNVCYQDP